MTPTVEKSFRGRTFRVVDPATYPGGGNTFEDEADIRERYWNVREGDVVVDVGAAYGGWALPAFASGAALVVAVEPDRTTRDILIESIRANDYGGRAIVPDVALYSDAPYPEALRAHFGALLEQWDGVAPRVTTLDRLVTALGLDRLDHIKVDIEGAELGFVEGAIETLRRFRPRLIIEDHTTIYPYCVEQRTYEGIVELLETLGYRTERPEYMRPWFGGRYFIAAEPS